MDRKTRQQLATQRLVKGLKQRVEQGAAFGGGGGGIDLSDANPAAVGTTAPGVDGDASRSDHVHAHGNQLGGTLHADAGASAGFMSAADKTKLDAIEAGAINALAGAGMTKTGSTLNVIANADASIVVNADDIQVGVITDAQHGNRGGGALHADATNASDGFATAAQITMLEDHETRIDTLEAAVITSSVTVSRSDVAANVDLTADGTRDWLYAATTTGVPRFHATSHGKVGGTGELKLGFEWIFRTGATANTNGNASHNATTTDNVQNSQFSTNQTVGPGTTATGTGYGFRLSCCAGTESSRLRVYLTSLQNTVTATATLTDGTTDNDTHVVTTQVTSCWEFVFQAAGAGHMLVVTFIVSDPTAATGHLRHLASTLSHV